MSYDYADDYIGPRERTPEQCICAGVSLSFLWGRSKPADPRDLETIVNLMEMAALSFEGPFTRAELFREMRAYGGEELALEEKDFRIVLRASGHLLRRVGRGLYAAR